MRRGHPSTKNVSPPQENKSKVSIRNLRKCKYLVQTVRQYYMFLGITIILHQARELISDSYPSCCTNNIYWAWTGSVPWTAPILQRLGGKKDAAWASFSESLFLNWNCSVCAVSFNEECAKNKAAPSGAMPARWNHARIISPVLHVPGLMCLCFERKREECCLCFSFIFFM